MCPPCSALRDVHRLHRLRQVGHLGITHRGNSLSLPNFLFGCQAAFAQGLITYTKPQPLHTVQAQRWVFPDWVKPVV